MTAPARARAILSAEVSTWSPPHDLSVVVADCPACAPRPPVAPDRVLPTRICQPIPEPLAVALTRMAAARGVSVAQLVATLLIAAADDA